MLVREAITLSHFLLYFMKKTRVCFLKTPYPLKNPELGFFLSVAWGWFVFGAQEQLWSDALPDTTYNPDRIWTHYPLAIDHELQALSTEPPQLLPSAVFYANLYLFLCRNLWF